jgi:hypothetical protein
LFFEKRHLWSDFDVEPTDEFLAKLLHADNLFHDESPAMSTFDQTDGHPRGLQKRGRRKSMKYFFYELLKIVFF